MKPYVIGISGKTAAGKTTLAKALAEELQGTFLSWDDFDGISDGPDDYVGWYHRGQDYHEWNYQVLANVLNSLKQQKSIDHPLLKNKLLPTQYIIFDAPLGLLHEQTGKYIDMCVHMSVPLDVLLCRRLIRDFKGQDKTKEEMVEEIEFYLYDARPLFLDDDLKKTAHLVVDGMLSTEFQVSEIKKYIVENALKS